MKEVFKWIILIVIFVFISFYFLKITTYIMKPDSSSLNNIAGFYGEKRNSLDMVYIGGSACFRYWEPLLGFEEYGIASYNFASSSIQAELYEMMIKEIEKTQKPSLIIIDARAFQYREDKQESEVGYRNALTGMPLSLNKVNFIHNNVKKYLGQSGLSYYFDIIKYHRDLKEAKINNQLRMAFNKYRNGNKGLEVRQKIQKYPINIKYDTKVEKPISMESEKILIKILEYIKSTNCNYLFIVSPYIETEEHKENFNYIEGIIKNYGYDFLDGNDYYEEMQLNFSTDFYDSAHVNLLGAEKYTNFLAKYIKEHYDLPDRRGEYKDWEELLPNWNKEVEKTKNEINKLIGDK